MLNLYLYLYISAISNVTSQSPTLFISRVVLLFQMLHLSHCTYIVCTSKVVLLYFSNVTSQSLHLHCLLLKLSCYFKCYISATAPTLFTSKVVLIFQMLHLSHCTYIVYFQSCPAISNVTSHSLHLHCLLLKLSCYFKCYISATAPTLFTSKVVLIFQMLHLSHCTYIVYFQSCPAISNVKSQSLHLHCLLLKLS